FRARLSGIKDLGQRLDCYREYVQTAPKPNEHRQTVGVDRTLALIVDRCLAVKPEQRFRDAGGILDALRLRERERRHRTVKLFGLLAPLGLLVLLAILSSLLVRSSLQETEKQATAQALKGCETPARVLTNALKRQTSQRIDLLEKVAGIEAFRQAL